MYTLYQMQDSGNCYKLRLALTQLQQPFRCEEIDILQGQSRSDEFLAKNPNGKVPLLQIAAEEPTKAPIFLPESNAGLWYLAEESYLLPGSRLGRAQVLQWMFFEQYSHEPYIATSRFWRHISGTPGKFSDELARARPKGDQALKVMEQHLSERTFFVEERYSIADIALYAYTHVAHQGGFDLVPYPAIARWLARVAAQERHIPITQAC